MLVFSFLLQQQRGQALALRLRFASALASGCHAACVFAGAMLVVMKDAWTIFSLPFLPDAFVQSGELFVALRFHQLGQLSLR